MSKGNKGSNVDNKQFYKSPMVLQIRLFNAPYDEIIHTQKKPAMQEMGGVKFLYIIDDFANMHHFRVDTIMSIHSWTKPNYTDMMMKMRKADEDVKSSPPTNVIEMKPVDDVIKTPEGKEIKVPTFKNYIETEEDGIWPTEEK